MATEECHELLMSLRARGLKIRASDGQLYIEAAKGVLTPSDLGELRARKPELIELLGRIDATRGFPIRPREPGALIPLTPLLDCCWSAWSAGKTSGSAPRSRRQCTFATRIMGPLDIGLLRACVETVNIRHEILRSRFRMVEGVPRQIVERSATALKFVDFSRQPPDIAAASIDAFISTLANVEIDVSCGPLFEAYLCRVSENEHVLILVLSHWITDGSSNVLLCHEIWTLYEQGESAQPFSLPSLPAQFGDYALWLEQTTAAWLDEHGAYWRDRLRGAQVTNIPFTTGLQESAETFCVWTRFQLDADLSAALRAFARRKGTMLPLVLLAIYAVVMCRWCGQRDLLLAIISSGRDRPELTGMVGWLATSLALRIRIEARWSFLDLLKQVTSEYCSATEHYDFQRAFQLYPEAFTPIHFNWLPTEHVWGVTPEKPCYGGVTLTPVFQRPACQDWFFPYFSDTPVGIEISVVYSPDHLSAAAIECFGWNMLGAARAVAREPGALLESLPWRAPGETGR
jgi:hypothetical protein